MNLSTYDNSNFKGFHQEKKKKNVGSACHQRMAETIEMDCSALLRLWKIHHIRTLMTNFSPRMSQERLSSK